MPLHHRHSYLYILHPCIKHSNTAVGTATKLELHTYACVQLQFNQSSTNIYKSENVVDLENVNFKLFDASFVICNPMWLAQANFNVRCSLDRQSFPEPRCTTAVTALTTTVAVFAIPEWIGGVPTAGYRRVSARLTKEVIANKRWGSPTCISSTWTVA